jgi:DNA-binding beta-propeller fold protein YncE
MNRLKSIFYLSLVPVIFSVFLSNFLLADAELRQPQWIGLSKDVGNIYLQWFRVQNAVAYIIERRIGEEGDFKEIAQVKNPSHRDFNISTDQVYFYRIIPLDKNGGKGSISEVRYVKLTVDEQGVISPPIWESHNIQGDGIAISWSHETVDKVLAYNLYRRAEGETDYSLITSSLSSVYLDKDVVRGSLYHYVLTAMDFKLQESDNSNVLVVQYIGVVSVVPENERIAKIKTLEEIVLRTGTDKIYSWENYGFLSPVDVEYDPSKDLLYVSDSGTGQITVINSIGQVVRRLGGKGDFGWAFERLMGIAVDEAGYVYATDAYRGEIVVFSPTGIFQRRIGLDEQLRHYFGPGYKTGYPGFRFGLVDIEVAGEGNLLVVDNPNGWLYFLEKNGTLIKVIGEKGFDPGKMQYPTFVLFDSKDRLLVSDTMNSRIQVFDLDGSHLNIVGGKGPGIGQFLRPKGVTADDAGSLYVADSQHNVIQVFNSDFEFIALLGDERGFPIDLGSPNGIFFIGPDRLVISERLSRRIQVRRLLKAPRAFSLEGQTP